METEPITSRFAQVSAYPSGQAPALTNAPAPARADVTASVQSPLQTPCVLAIVGPTASGKSSLADALAYRLSTAVISVDAMQVYRYMDIGTAKMPQAQRHAPLLMIDRVLPSQTYSAQQFQRAARSEVKTLLKAGKTPILCGGGGLYLDSVIDDMHFPKGSDISPARKKYEELLREKGAQALWDELYQRDPESARCIHPHNVRRTIRALEMSGEQVSYAQQTRGLHEHKVKYPTLIIGLAVERAIELKAIERRVDEMFRDGLVAEVEDVLKNYSPLSKTASQAIGYKEIVGYLEGSSTLERAREEIIINTRRYAKRQRSWFRRDPRIVWIEKTSYPTEEALLEEVLRRWNEARARAHERAY